MQRITKKFLSTRFAARAATRSQPPPRNPSVKGIAMEVLTSQQLEGDPLKLLKVSESYWKELRTKGEVNPRKVVQLQPGQRLADVEYDVCVCGGTLGIFMALALQMRGYKVCVVEKRLVRGRKQEWNTSKHELQALVRMGLLSETELESCIATSFNPVRVGFHGHSPDLWVQDCLHLGVDPEMLIDLLRQRFEQLGGVVMENTAVYSVNVKADGVEAMVRGMRAGADTELHVGDTNRPNAVIGQHKKSSSDSTSGNAHAPTNSRGSQPLKTVSRSPGSRAAGPRPVTCRLLLDCMGHYSDIVKQIRGGRKPDGVCIVVGSCAEGFPQSRNRSADLLVTLGDSFDDMQLYWEAFPAHGCTARTTYMFTYTDAVPERPSFERLLDLYFSQLPAYQGVPLNSLSVKRVLFGAFPCYASSAPLQPGFDRVLQIGDASASQSPLSFGGFGNMLKQLPRLTRSLTEALHQDRLSRYDLSFIHGYQPALSVAWLFQRAMSIKVGQLEAGTPDFNSRDAELSLLLRKKSDAAVGNTASSGTSAASEEQPGNPRSSSSSTSYHSGEGTGASPPVALSDKEQHVPAHTTAISGTLGSTGRMPVVASSSLLPVDTRLDPCAMLVEDQNGLQKGLHEDATYQAALLVSTPASPQTRRLLEGAGLDSCGRLGETETGLSSSARLAANQPRMHQDVNGKAAPYLDVHASTQNYVASGEQPSTVTVLRELFSSLRDQHGTPHAAIPTQTLHQQTAAQVKLVDTAAAIPTQTSQQQTVPQAKPVDITAATIALTLPQKAATQPAKAKHAQAEKRNSVSNQEASSPRVKHASASQSSHQQLKMPTIAPLCCIPPDFINNLLAVNFKVMHFLGDRILRPFLQDSLQLLPLTLTLLLAGLAAPVRSAKVVLQVGPLVAVAWLVHYMMLVAYTLAAIALRPLRSWVHAYRFQRVVDLMECGAGLEYQYVKPKYGPASAMHQQKQA